MEIKVPLKAAKITRVSAPCKSFLLLDTGVADFVSLSVEFVGNMQPEEMGNRVRGFKMRAGDGNTAVQTLVFTAPEDCTVTILTSNPNIDFNFADGQNVVATIDSGQLPLPVELNKGTVGQPLYVSGITYADAPAASITDRAAVAVGAGGAVIVGASSTRKSLRMANVGTDPVAVGAPGITWAKRVIVLEAGDVWIEDRAANLAWSAITDAGKTASITAQEVSA